MPEVVPDSHFHARADAHAHASSSAAKAGFREVTWAWMFKVDPDLTRRIWAMARRFGYCNAVADAADSTTAAGQVVDAPHCADTDAGAGAAANTDADADVRDFSGGQSRVRKEPPPSPPHTLQDFQAWDEWERERESGGGRDGGIGVSRNKE